MTNMMRRIVEKKYLIFGRRHVLRAVPQRCASFLNGSNANYIDELYESWKKDKESVHKSWSLIFQAAERGVNIRQYYTAPSPNAFSTKFPEGLSQNINVSSDSFNIVIEQMNIAGLIAAYQSRGHILSQVDPFNCEFSDPILGLAELVPEYWGFNSKDMEKLYTLPATTEIFDQSKKIKLSEIIQKLRNVYTGSIGYEYMHIEDTNRIQWLRQRIESDSFIIDADTKKNQLKRLLESTLLENYLAKKFPSEKRFGLEGCDSLISGLSAMLDRFSLNGVTSVVFGMAHRGRLNVLANICAQPLEHIFARFNDELAIEEGSSGDVKYHLGVSNTVKSPITSKDILLSMVANPSHLEAVDPVVKGKVKAEQISKGDDGSQVLAILIHGDAAFSGQGIVYETVNLAELPAYCVHGTVHIVINNQIGFTTDPSNSRSARYCSDLAKAMNSPIFHVNADDPEAVYRVALLAADYRMTFKKDVYIDLIGYRRNGHNEGDNPFFTQPLMYKSISSRPDCLKLYSNKLIEEKIITADEFSQMRTNYESHLEEEYLKAQKSSVVLNNIWIDSPWKGFFKKDKSFEKMSTGVDIDKIKKFQTSCLTVPNDLNIHPMIKRVLSARSELLASNKLDWAMGEIAAFSTLLTEGVHVRLTGQDSERGTFSHRHHVLHDVSEKGKVYNPLSHLDPKQSLYTVANSPLSEYAVLGFEHGYSMTSPHTLSIWEAQFGDFFNTAQCIVDQFISAGEDKWVRQSGVVLLLPHGFDGQGSEHSSARIERFLQLCKEDPDNHPDYKSNEFEVRQLYGANQIVAYPTTPANLFHLLRRQLAYNFRKPLIIFSPKSLLRHELARSSFDELGPGTSFQRLIRENNSSLKNKSVKRLIFCSGKIYYELFKARASKSLQEFVAISRIEQLSPFPFDLVSEEIQKFPNAQIVFVQEEPKNQGPYYHVKPMITLCSGNSKALLYVGRPVSASPATGSKYQHNIEQNKLIEEAFDF